MLTEQHPEVADTLDSLGTVAQQRGNPVEAETFYQRALSIYRIRLGEMNIRVGILMSKIACLYRAVDPTRWRDARELYEGALEIKKRALGPRDLEVAHTLNELGCLLSRMQLYAEADKRFSEALDIRIDVAGYQTEVTAEV